MNAPSWAKDQGGAGGPLGLAKPYPLADARQVFQGDPATGAFSLGHDVFAILWLMFVACRASLRRRFFSRRLADLVCFFCSLAAGRARGAR